MEYETFIKTAVELSTVIEDFFRKRDIEIAGAMTVMTGAWVTIIRTQLGPRDVETFKLLSDFFDEMRQKSIEKRRGKRVDDFTDA